MLARKGISAEMLGSYHRDGVLKIDMLFAPVEFLAVRRALAEYEQATLDRLPKSDYTLEPDGVTVRNFWRMQDHNPFFRDLIVRPELLQLVKPLVGGDPEPVGVETFNKPARVGTAVPYHQDNAYFCYLPPDALTVWIAIDPVTDENGPVEYLLGSHSQLLPHTPSGVKGNSFGLAALPDEGMYSRMSGHLDPGGALVHHCQTIHRSHENVSDAPRQSLILVYRGRHTRKDAQLLHAYEKAVAATPPDA